MEPAATKAIDVHVGRDGHLFLSGGKHSVFELFSGERPPSAGSAATFVRNMEERAAFCAALGTGFSCTVFPDKCVVMGDLTGSASRLGSAYLRYYLSEVEAAGLADLTRYPLDALRAEPGALPRTDTHYSAEGYAAVVPDVLRGLLAEDTIATGMAVLRGHIGRREGYSGDLGTKLTPSPKETISVLTGNPSRAVLCGNGVQSGNQGICILVEAEAALTDRTLLIFGDSFFRGMLRFLSVFYRRIAFCRTRYFHYEMVQAFHPDDIVCGLAERYLSRVSPDDERPHFLSYPLMLGRTIQPDEGFAQMWARFVDAAALASVSSARP